VIKLVNGAANIIFKNDSLELATDGLQFILRTEDGIRYFTDPERLFIYWRNSKLRKIKSLDSFIEALNQSMIEIKQMSEALKKYSYKSPGQAYKRRSNQ
jgi:hypothetical protein